VTINEAETRATVANKAAAAISEVFSGIQQYLYAGVA
jgi:hypothetical protein